MRGIEKLAAVERSTPPMAEAFPALPMAETVLLRLLRIGLSGLGQFMEPVFQQIGLNDHAFHVLCLLVASPQGKASPGELSELAAISRANMTRVLDGLVKDGFASRTIETRDARRHTIRITAAGRRATEQAVPKMVGPLKSAFAGLNADELVVLDSLLRKAILSFDKNAQLLRRAA